MNWNDKNLGPLAAFSLIAGSNLLSAVCCDDMYMRNLENRVAALECQSVCCTVVNPPARPFAQDCWGFYIAVDPLLWQAHENGLPVGIQTDDSVALFNSSGESKTKGMSFHWTWGFRLTGGFNFDYDGWDTALTWTRWYPDASGHFSAGQDDTIFTTQGAAGLAASNGIPLRATRVSDHWKARLNILDWQLGREFFVSKYLIFRPFAGLRSAWIGQKFKTIYTGLSNNPATPDPGRRVKHKSDFWGLGILGGVETEWSLGCGWGIFANFSTSLLHGFIKLDFDEYSLPRDKPRAVLIRNDNFYHLGRVITDAQLGIRYDWISCDECLHLGAHLGWEQHMFWGQNQFMQLVDSNGGGKTIANQGDLSAQGFFLRIRFDF